MAAQIEKFTGVEAFVLDLFTRKHEGKSGVGFTTKDNTYKITIFPRGHVTKEITVEKKGDLAFEAEIKVGPAVAAKITWQADLTYLLMRLEHELTAEYAF